MSEVWYDIKGYALKAFLWKGVSAMENKITIIEGPTPTFELVNEGWVSGINEGYGVSEVAKTTLRAKNAAALLKDATERGGKSTLVTWSLRLKMD
jgi:hypothetical protein